MNNLKGRTVYSISFPSICSAVCTGMNDVSIKLWPLLFRSKDVDCIPKCRIFSASGKARCLDWEVFCSFWRDSAFAACLTFTERTEVEFSQDLILRLAQNSLIEVLLLWPSLTSQEAVFLSGNNLFIYLFIYLFSFFFFKFYFIFKLYKIVLVLPNIKMNPPQVYMYRPLINLL